MKTTSFKIGIALAAILYLCYAGFVVGTAPMLPEQVASHFGFGGKPNAWMGKQQFLTFSICFGLLLPLVITGLFAAITVLPHRLVNLPNKDHWLGPEQKENTRRWLINSGLWLASLMLMMLLSTHWLVIQANRSEPVRLPGTGLGIAFSLFGVGFAAWLILFLRHFSKRASQ